MLKNYLKTAWRNLAGNRFYSLINILGLACGLATALLLLLWVQHERSYDRFHRDYENIFRISVHIDANGEEVVYDIVPGPLSVFAQSIPGVMRIVRINNDDDQVIATADRSRVIDGFRTAYVDSTFFDIFDFRLLSGDKSRPLPDNNSVVLTQTTARKLFGSTEPLGAAIRFGNDNFTVTGILEDFPRNSTLRYDALFPMGHYGQSFTARGGNGEWKTIDDDLGNYAFSTFVRLEEDADPASVGEAFSRLLKTTFESASRSLDLKVDFRLQALKDLHLVSIIGVVRDFNFKPLKEKITPLLFSRWWSGNILYVRTAAGETRQAIAAVEKQYEKYAGDIPFSYSFIDEQLKEKYTSDQRAGLLFNIFAGIAIFISCLGLFGLSTYTVRQRVKEIGIRKVLGAEAFSIVRLLSKSSVLSVIISFLIASPLTWWLMNRWLADYAYRIEIKWWMFALAGVSSMAIALLTVGVQTVRAALANPVESLRSE